MEKIANENRYKVPGRLKYQSLIMALLAFFVIDSLMYFSLSDAMKTIYNTPKSSQLLDIDNSLKNITLQLNNLEIIRNHINKLAVTLKSISELNQTLAETKLHLKYLSEINKNIENTNSQLNSINGRLIDIEDAIILTTKKKDK